MLHIVYQCNCAAENSAVSEIAPLAIRTTAFECSFVGVQRRKDSSIGWNIVGGSRRATSDASREKSLRTPDRAASLGREVLDNGERSTARPFAMQIRGAAVSLCFYFPVIPEWGCAGARTTASLPRAPVGNRPTRLPDPWPKFNAYARRVRPPRLKNNLPRRDDRRFRRV